MEADVGIFFHTIHLKICYAGIFLEHKYAPMIHVRIPLYIWNAGLCECVRFLIHDFRRNFPPTLARTSAHVILEQNLIHTRAHTPTHHLSLALSLHFAEPATENLCFTANRGLFRIDANSSFLNRSRALAFRLPCLTSNSLKRVANNKQ